jgi:hypothetical protein
MSTSTAKRLLLVMIISLGCTAYTQDGGTTLLHRAVYCLVSKKFLPLPKTTNMTFGYHLDEKSYPGKQILYVVNYPNLSQREGFAFTLFLSNRDDHLDFNIQNNARFVLSTNGVGEIRFLTPPLGGTWTQEHLVSAIKKIERKPKFTILTKVLLAVDHSVTCEAYTDPQPKAQSE